MAKKLTAAERAQAEAMHQRAMALRQQAASTEQAGPNSLQPVGASSSLPQAVAATCNSCHTNPVQGIQLGARIYAPRCTQCRERDERQERSAARQAMLDERERNRATRHTNIVQLLANCGVDVQAGSPIKYGATSLDNYNPLWNPEALAVAMEFVAKFLAGERPNLFFWSHGPGPGKTHLSVAILRQLVLAGAVEAGLGRPTALFIRESRLTITLRRMCEPGGRPEKYLDRLLGADLLILDDVGKAKTDSAWLRELLFELVAGLESKSLISSSNWALEELEARDPWYAPLGSRMAAKGPMVPMHGPDMRNTPGDLMLTGRSIEQGTQTLLPRETR